MATASSIRPTADIDALLNALTENQRASFGADIHEAEQTLLSDAALEEKKSVLMKWLARNSPCLFARMGAKHAKGVNLPLCWLDEDDFALGSVHLMNMIQLARRRWKREALDGQTSAFLIMFNHRKLARAAPDEAFVALLCSLADLYLVERAPIRPDIIYSEAVPLEVDGRTRLFRAGVNFFYPAAHETINHDRRAPGGVLVSVNSPGHLANAWVKLGLEPDFETATSETRKLAIRSVGNGGHGSAQISSCSWHNLEIPAGGAQKDACPSERDYSAIYHTDVLVPTLATLGRGPRDRVVWDNLKFDYISTRTIPFGHPNYALYRGHPVDAERLFDNPWPPRHPDTLEDILAA
jgi:hypothetical protein